MALYERELQIKEKCLHSLKEWKKLILENYEDDIEKCGEIEKIKNVVLEYCVIERDCLKKRNGLKLIEERIETENSNEDTNEIDLDEIYSQFLNEASTSSVNYEEDNIWKEIFGDDDVVEVKKKRTEVGVSTFEELGDSLLFSDVFSPPIDPISKIVIRNPYKNKKCKHIYENSTITSYIKQLKNKAKCPYIGCNNSQLRMSDLVEDRNLQSQISQYLETQQDESASESD